MSLPQVPNPCCMSLQQGVKTIAIIDIVLETLLLILTGLAVIALLFMRDQINDNFDGEITVVVTVAAILALLVLVAGLILAIILLKGAQNRNRSQCMTWLIITVVLFIINIAGLILSATNSSSSYGWQGYVSGGVSIAVRVYMIWVVTAFINEIDRDIPTYTTNATNNGTPLQYMYQYPPPNQQYPPQGQYPPQQQYPSQDQYPPPQQQFSQ